jgi:hypothetical protein
MARRADGRLRTVGVEIEFAGLSPEQAAKALAGRVGGRLRRIDPHAFQIRGSKVGNLSVELDSRYVHPGKMEEGFLSTVMPKLASLFGSATSYVIPCELVTGPIPIDHLHEVQDCIAALRQAGARGTQDGPFFAFGLHFNPEAPSLDVATLAAIMKSFVLLNGWLRRETALDLTRSFLGFADPFPDTYSRLLCDPSYGPTLESFIDDYLAANPTRNRDCDLLPLLTHLDPERVRRALPGEKINPRPTFHYRLPDARISDPGWTIAPDWNRWVAVERLAADPDRLARLGEAYLRFDQEPSAWADVAQRIAFE